MKNLKLVRVILIMMVSVVIISISGQVFADNVTELPVDFNSLIGNGTTENTTNTANNAVVNNTPTVNNATVNNSVLTTNNVNTSNTNNSSLPNTGIGDTVPVAVLLLVFAVSAIYAYRKIQDYKNI